MGGSGVGPVLCCTRGIADKTESKSSAQRCLMTLLKEVQGQGGCKPEAAVVHAARRVRVTPACWHIWGWFRGRAVAACIGSSARRQEGGKFGGLVTPLGVVQGQGVDGLRETCTATATAARRAPVGEGKP